MGGWTVPDDLLIRPYRPADDRDWLRCRVLSFLRTAYFDDIATSRPRYDEPSNELVAERAGVLVGVLDLTLPDDLTQAATVETVAVHTRTTRDAVRRRPCWAGCPSSRGCR